MPRKIKVSREEILCAALDLVRERGAEELNARTLAVRLGCSTQPLFSNFENMEALRRETIGAAYARYSEYLANGMTSSEYPAYKASGMAYIRFAREEKQLFRLLFMRDRSGEEIPAQMPDVDEIIGIICRNVGLNEEQARRFHLEMWVCVHGIASMMATSYLEMDERTVSGILTDLYMGLKKRYQEGNTNGCD